MIESDVQVSGLSTENCRWYFKSEKCRFKREIEVIILNINSPLILGKNDFAVFFLTFLFTYINLVLLNFCGPKQDR